MKPAGESCGSRMMNVCIDRKQKRAPLINVICRLYCTGNIRYMIGLRLQYFFKSDIAFERIFAFLALQIYGDAVCKQYFSAAFIKLVEKFFTVFIHRKRFWKNDILIRAFPHTQPFAVCPAVLCQDCFVEQVILNIH